MAWTMEQAYPIFLDVVLCVLISQLFYFIYIQFILYICMYGSGYRVICISKIEYE